MMHSPVLQVLWRIWEIPFSAAYGSKEEQRAAEPVLAPSVQHMLGLIKLHREALLGELGTEIALIREKKVDLEHLDLDMTLDQMFRLYVAKTLFDSLS